MEKVKKKLNANKASVMSMPIINPDAAGIDVSATMHMVAVRPDIGKCPVRKFEAFTEDLYAIADWLKQCKVTTVAMESTGVYWKQLYLVLVEREFEVALVNAKHVKNVTGRKTDVSDAQWIQKLHSCGLLRSSFLPDDTTESLRSLVRHRKRLQEDSSKYVLRMQKAMELMNIKLPDVINDIMGKTGKAIVEAILGGERKAENFLQYLDPRIKTDHETIRKALVGNWRAEHLFLMEENYKMYGFIQQRITRCDQEIELYLQKQEAKVNDGLIEEKHLELEEAVNKRKKKTKNHPNFNVREYLTKIHGVDVMDIYGISANSALEILSETGTDLSKWEDENKFVSWLNLCPNNKIIGGKLISSTLLKKKAGQASKSFRAAANGLQRSDNWLGDYFRRKKAKAGNKYAIVATAHKLAIIYYKMVRNKVKFQPLDKDEYRKKYNGEKIARLEKQLAKLKTAA